MTTLVERLDLPAVLPRARSRRDTETETVQFAQAALAVAKQEGLRLAVRARYVALAVIACLLPIINPAWEQLYYVVLLGPFALIGWAQVRVGRVGVSRPELALLFCDLALLTFIAVVPNPFSSAHWPGGDAIPFRQLHLFLRAAVGRDAGLFLAHCHRGRNMDLCSLDLGHGLGVVAARS